MEVEFAGGETAGRRGATVPYLWKAERLWMASSPEELNERAFIDVPFAPVAKITS